MSGLLKPAAANCQQLGAFISTSRIHMPIIMLSERNFGAIGRKVYLALSLGQNDVRLQRHHRSRWFRQHPMNSHACPS